MGFKVAVPSGDRCEVEIGLEEVRVDFEQLGPNALPIAALLDEFLFQSELTWI
jgi:hypothetical protein